LRGLASQELIRRPVHAKILADLALIPDQNIKIASEYELYQEFIFRIEERDSKKAARRDIDTKSRIEFMLDIAWWLWEVAKADSFSILDIPDSIAEKWKSRFRDSVDRETALRELLTGSVLERSKIDRIFETKDEIVSSFHIAHIGSSWWPKS
jgi:hypothetical protein